MRTRSLTIEHCCIVICLSLTLAATFHRACTQIRPSFLIKLGVKVNLSTRDVNSPRPFVKHLRRLLRAKRVQFFQKDGKVTDVRETEALESQAKAVDMGFQLQGSYAPRDPKEAAQYGVKIIIADIPGPPGEFNQFIDVVPPKHPKNYGSYGGDNVNKPEKS